MKITIIATGFNSGDDKFAKTEVAPEAAPVKTAEMPEIGESNVSDDDISEIISMLKKSKENK